MTGQKAIFATITRKICIRNVNLTVYGMLNRGVSQLKAIILNGNLLYTVCTRLCLQIGLCANYAWTRDCALMMPCHSAQNSCTRRG